MKKLLAAVVAFLLLVIVLALVLQGPAAPPPSAWLVLPDGSSKRIVAVTYGTNHIIGSPFGRMLARLPDSWQDELPTLIHRTDTSQPMLVVWLERRAGPNTPPPVFGVNYERLSDAGGFISGPQNSPVGGFGTVDMGPAAFESFPRRDPKITVNFFYPSASGTATNCGSLQFPNPLYRAYPEWQPEPLPAKRVTDDFGVTLLGVHIGSDHAAVDLRTPPPADGRTWQVAGIEVSDATGNHVHNSMMNWSFIGDVRTISFQPTLWPSEKAWKLKFEFAQTAGFAPDTLLTFKNVPLGALNAPTAVGRTTNFAGITLTLASITRHPPNTNAFNTTFTPSNARLTNSPLPAGTRLDLLKVIYDQGTTNQSESFSYSDNERNYSLSQIPLDAKTADFIFAVHQSRFVEFTVHPEPPPPATNSPSR